MDLSAGVSDKTDLMHVNGSVFQPIATGLRSAAVISMHQIQSQGKGSEKEVAKT